MTDSGWQTATLYSANLDSATVVILQDLGSQLDHRLHFWHDGNETERHSNYPHSADQINYKVTLFPSHFLPVDLKSQLSSITYFLSKHYGSL